MTFTRQALSILFVFISMWTFAQQQNGKTDHQSFPVAISLAGEWQFQLDSLNKGISDAWYSRNLSDQISLPGTTDEGKKGKENRNSELKSLTRIFPYIGAAWYQREIEIPEQWEGKNLFFLMERTKTSSVWVDGMFVGSQNSLTTGHRYDLSKFLTPGKHLLSVCINNAIMPPLGDSHQVSDNTQTNWNGILGRIELQAKDEVYITDAQAFPDLKAQKINLRIHFNKGCKGKLVVTADAVNTNIPHRVVHEVDYANIPGADFCETALYLGELMQLWDEFSPVLYRLKIDFIGEIQETDTSDGKESTSENIKVTTVHDSQELTIGMREFVVREGQFQVNGKTIFLRGKHDACVFPLTGYAPMDMESWLRIFRIAKSYGINHYRYHTWCPPRAAFEAADRVGIYMQPELPMWAHVAIYDDAMGEERIRYATEEGFRILKEFGNHASFCMFALGNELGGEPNLMKAMIEKFRQNDSRHLYAVGSNNFLRQPKLVPGDDYWTTMMTGGQYTWGNFFPDTRGMLVRGSFAVHTTGHINNQYPGTMKDYTWAIQGVPVPVIGHETGQFQVYPDFSEINKYTGVLRARNFEIFKERLKNAGMLDQANDFVKASGALSVLCYREDIEAALRTPGFGGFQLLDLQDFSGQGTALVGVLNAFMESKGLISPEDWRNFCNDVVPLARFEKYTWTNEEVFSARLQVANYSDINLVNNPLQWHLADQSGTILKSGEMRFDAEMADNLLNYGTIKFDFEGIDYPQKLFLKLKIKDTSYQNEYPIWLYPENPNTVPPRELFMARTLDEEALERLENGEKVLLLPDNSSINQAIPGAFQSDFWCYPMFKRYNPPGTLGILCNPEHPALKDFPTEFHSNWQWWPLLKNGSAMILDQTPPDFRPIVQVIDNFERNHKLGVIFECRVGSGKLLVCSCNLLEQQQYPEARQLLSSLINYMNSKEFDPQQQIQAEVIEGILRKN